MSDSNVHWAEPGHRLEETGGRLEVAERDVLISNPGTHGIPDEQLHFPHLYESTNGNWYMMYCEGPHHEGLFNSPGNRVQCVQSMDRGKTWLPWMGLRAQTFMYHLFTARLADGSLISCRTRMTGLHERGDERKPADGTVDGTAILLRSDDEGATWSRRHVPVLNMPCSDDAHLITLWGPAIEMSDGRLVWCIISRERTQRNSLAAVVESTDGGGSFRFLAALCHNVYEEVGLEPREPGMILLPSGELLALIRCTPMLQVRSSDGGRTWGAPLKLDRPGICPQLLLLKNGVLVCSYGTRQYLHIMASWDGEGRQWSKPLVLYEGQTSGYSTVQTLGADRFRVCYQEGTFNKFQPGPNRIVRTEVEVTRGSR